MCQGVVKFWEFEQMNYISILALLSFKYNWSSQDIGFCRRLKLITSCIHELMEDIVLGREKGEERGGGGEE